MYGDFTGLLNKRFLAEFENIEVGFNFDYGVEFEIALCRMFQTMLPTKFGVTRGYAVGREGEMIGDDILIYEKMSFPTVSARGDLSLMRKEKVPVDAIYTYIEAKHSVVLEGEGPQSLNKAIQQVDNVKKLVSERPVRRKEECIDGVVLNGDGVGIDIGFSDGYPEYLNPPHGILFARNVKITGAGPDLTCEEIYEFLVDGTMAQDLTTSQFPPDLIVLGPDIVVLPVHPEEGTEGNYRAPFAPEDHDQFAVIKCPGRAFGVGLACIFEALDWIKLKPMPWRAVAISGMLT